MCTTVDTSNISSCQKKHFFSFPVAVNNSIKVGPLVFLLYVFLKTENIMKRPVCDPVTRHRWSSGLPSMAPHVFMAGFLIRSRDDFTLIDYKVVPAEV